MSHVAVVLALGAGSPFSSSRNATVRPVFASQRPSYAVINMDSAPWGDSNELLRLNA